MQLRVIDLPLVNVGVIHPILSRLIETWTVTVVVLSVIVDGVTVIVAPDDTEFDASTAWAAEIAAVAVPPGMIAFRHP